MAKIKFSLANGSVHTLSESRYGAEGPMTGRDAAVQLSLITEKLRYFTADDGVIVFTSHIVSATVER